MKLSKRIERAFGFIVAVSLAIVFGVLVGTTTRNTFAENDGTIEAYAMDEGAKFVTFYDGGEKLIVRTDAHTVEEALARAGIVINVGDVVEPGLDAEINADNFYVNVYRARPVIVQDGKIEKYLMTASYDMKTIVREAGFTVYDGDEIDFAPNTDFLETGVANVYRVTRNGGRTITEEIEIPYVEETVRDVDLESGKSEVRQLGELGAKKVYYDVYYVDNVEVSREVVREEVIREPVNRVVAVGAKRSLPPEAGTCADWARQAGVSEAELAVAVDLIYHESGCRVDASNASGAYGIPQALPGSKMASAGADWATNPVTQIKWMIGYVNGRYGGWSQALSHWYAHGWY